ncbi:MAG TPA: NAD-glutamate dehydrogenase [Actinomycetota bacterium]|nr:NAD-glutamate dehydrogenase [Actinomycetota bacterium]
MDTIDPSRGAPPAPAGDLARHLAERVPAERLATVEAFARAYTRRLGHDRAALTPEELAGQVVTVFALVDGRDGADEAVRVFNPEVERDGYTSAGSVLEVNTADSPFLLDSLTEELEARGLGTRRVIHPVIGTLRDDAGRVERVVDAREATVRESVMHFEMDRRLEEAEIAELSESVRSILDDVRLAVRDFRAMRETVRRMMLVAEAASPLYGREEIDETVAFLRWLLNDNFVFLGAREYEIVDTPDGPAMKTVEGSGLGILSKPGWSTFETPVPIATLEPKLRARIEAGDLLVYAKTNRTATVHRRERMDHIGVRRVSPDGRVAGEVRLLGLFTSKAYMAPASQTPLLHRKLGQILEAEELFEGSHDYKAAVSIFDSFPKAELLAAPVEDLRRQVVGLLALQEQRHVRLFERRDPYGRNVSLLVVMPRDTFNAELRDRLQELFMRRFKGSSVDYHLSLGESQLAQVHFTVHVALGEVPDVPFGELEEEVIELARTWDERLGDRLVELAGEERGRALAERWSPRFPETYKAATAVEVAATDVLRFDELERGDEPFVVGLSNEVHDAQTLTRVRLYKIGGKIQLSDFVPTLESLGLRVVEEVPTDLVHDVADERFLQDFGVLAADGRPIDVDTAGPRIAGCIAAVWRGECEMDSLNRLVVLADLDWQQVQILRAYRKYHHRVNASFPVEYKNDAFAAHPDIAVGIVRLFESRFDPSRPQALEAADRVRAEVLRALDGVASLEEDRILRNHLGLVDATVRTNAYVPGRSALSFKFRSALVPEMPRPTPLFEIFVYSPEVEGIHLRGGRVARGGIRWSDRRQDYRTEVLGLMKAQMVKNAVIVPTGSKGGFVLKRRISDPTALKQEVTGRYVTFMRGMLDVTDNLVDGKVVHPTNVVVHDDDDPYLVVAADKGTAALSDTANAVSAEYGFWLGDAFASGGSAGYDHKALGITARGAWESVKRHFVELGTDVMSQPFTVVGIGDMSGDVFGNGMLLSDQICLVAAFDHRHVFVDPNPVPAAGFAERRRLFELPGSTWDDYDRSTISSGGGVWPRTAKSIPLTPEMRGALGVDGDAVTPDELISAILRAPVDLLWNGGIGTYVKAHTESHADVGDRVNDAVRVDGRDLRCRVVAEGGNLGLTQRGRIEYALAGGRINAGFIDNSAGVDSSDHEVNLKILLGLAVARGELTLEERNALLAEVEQDVVRHVLYDNFLQAQILSQETKVSASRMEAYDDLMQTLEAEGVLERDIEFLPGVEETAERRRAGRGMTRPELAVLLAYAKQSLANALLDSTLPDSRYLEQDLRGYFPRRVVERFADLVHEHPLRRELVATIVANDVVNSQGITFVTRLIAETGASAADVVSAYRIARDVTGAVERWEAIEALVGRIDPALSDGLMSDVDRLVEVSARWYLQHAHGQLGRAVEAHAAPFRRLERALPSIAAERRLRARERETWRLVDAGVPEDVARGHAFLDILSHAPSVIAVARRADLPVETVGRVFALVGEAAFIDWLEERLEQVPTVTRWHRWALHAVWDDLRMARRQIAERVLAEAPGLDPDEAVEAFLASRGEVLERLRRFMSALAVEEVSDLAAATVAVRQIRALGVAGGPG